MQSDAAPSESIKRALALDEKATVRGRYAGLRRAGVAVLVTAATVATLHASGVIGSDRKPTYTTQPVERGDMTVYVTATGSLVPLTQVEISSELSGVVRSVAVRENQRVRKGQVLAELDTVRMAAQVARARASLEAVKAKVKEARVTYGETSRELDRAQRLALQGMATEQALEAAQAARDRAASALTTAKANQATADAELQLVQTDLIKSRIVAPIDGIVLSRNVDPGQTVAASFQAPVLFVIAEDLRRMELVAAVDEADIGSVRAGQAARFTVDAFPCREFKAEISDVSYASTSMDGIVTYEARLTVANADLLLRPGMTATVSIITHRHEDVLLVPNEALRFSPPAGPALSGPNAGSDGQPGSVRGTPPPRAGARAREEPRVVYVLRDGRPAPIRVKIGASNGATTEVLFGLGEGDTVVTASQPVHQMN